jgi:hypothetical protein
VKPGDAIDVLAHFFNDVIGNVGPGIFFLFGLNLIHARAGLNPAIHTLSFDNTTSAIIALALGYTIGHGLLGLHGGLRSLLRRAKISPPPFATRLQNGPTYKFFLQQLSRVSRVEEHAQQDFINLDFNTHRSVAMTLSPEGGAV